MKTHKSVNPAAKEFGGYIRSRRLSLGLSRADLARRLGLILGSHISHVERGEARISPAASSNWAQALEIEPQAFCEHLDRVVKADEAHTLTLAPSSTTGLMPQIALA